MSSDPTPSKESLLSVATTPWVKAGDLVLISGQIATDAAGLLLHPGDVQAQAKVAFLRIQRLVEEAGGKMDDLIDIVAFLLDVRDAEKVLQVAREFLSEPYPAWTIAGTQGLHRSGSLVQIHAVASLDSAPKLAFTPDSSKWMRTYPMSAACRRGAYLFVSGHMALDLDGNVINSGDHRAQSRYIFNRLKEVIELAGGHLDRDLLDILSFSIDPRSFDPMCIDVGCAEFLTMPLASAPSWSVIGSTGLFKPGVFHTVRVICELDHGPAVAYTPTSIFWRYLPVSGGTKKEQGKLLCIAGEVSMDMDGQIVCPGDPVAQARYAFNRIKEVVEMAGGTMDDIVDIISFHKDIRWIDAVLKVSQEYFKQRPPAWTAVGYPGGYFEGHLHEICARAWLK